MNFTFASTERLKSRKLIGRMFKDGHSFGAYPVRLLWLRQEAAHSDAPVQVCVVVPKRSFKSAVARNRIRRKVREAWRLNKHWLYQRLEGRGGQYAFLLLYVAKEDLPYQEIEAALRQMNRRFLQKNFPKPANPKAG